ncbi:MAG: glycosyltransferase family 4 protein [Candidatus Yanofskybacteria bacterium]|nr:glycosyltransferase family 4 protein [Candidatus Yanofskybacteria bacterium]
MIRIGIECESIEGPESWGIGRIIKKLLEEITNRPELADEFRFFLYFKLCVPDLPFLNNPIFVKKAVGISSFSLYYYLFLPIKLWFERLDMMFFPNYMLPILFRGKSLVMLTEDIYYEINSGTLPWRYKLAYKIFANWAAKHATRIMTISETSKREVARLFQIDHNRIMVNQLGVDKPKQITDYILQISGDYVLYVGQAFPRRHLRETMLAFELIAGQFADLKLITVGKDKYNPPIIKTLAQEINNRIGKERIIYKEYASEDELVQLYAHAKLLVYVSSKEAFGLPPLEALSYGVPAIVADQKVTREIFGDNAFFVQNPDNLKLIADAIRIGLNNEQKCQEIKNSREDILKKYTWKEHMERFLRICRNF